MHKNDINLSTTSASALVFNFLLLFIFNYLLILSHRDVDVFHVGANFSPYLF